VRGDTEKRAKIDKKIDRTIIDLPEYTATADCDKLFLSSTGRPITANTIKLVFSRLAKSSGVKRLHCHLCRHTFAINYLLNGGDIFSLREILGHTTLEMVNHYLHFTGSQLTAQHHKYSPMDKLQKEQGVSKGNRSNPFKRK
jgi:site-specific recombinase XerD